MTSTLTIKNTSYDINVFDLLTGFEQDLMTPEMLKDQLSKRQGMNLARRLWKNLEVKSNINDVSERSTLFRTIVIQYFEMSKFAASTYLNNIRNGMYVTNKKWNQKNKKRKTTVDISSNVVEQTEEVVVEENVVSTVDIIDEVVDVIVEEPKVEINVDLRWKLWLNDVVVNSFESRQKGRDYIKQNQLPSSYKLIG